jgi:RNA polymerase sigma-70 factor (ECF subfamily)
MGGSFKRPDRPSSGDDERFSCLYKETSEDLFAFVLRRSATASDAADCMAETYRIAWEKRTRIPAGDEARPWLFGVARNVVRRQRTSAERALAVSRELALAAESSETLAISEESAAAAALFELSPLDREIVTMLTWDSLAPREVAAILGLSPNVVRVRAHRARQRLRTRLAETDASDGADVPDASAATAGRGG